MALPNLNLILILLKEKKDATKTFKKPHKTNYIWVAVLFLFQSPNASHAIAPVFSWYIILPTPLLTTQKGSETISLRKSSAVMQLIQMEQGK